MNDECPSDTELARFIYGNVELPRSGPLHEHLTKCPACQLRLEPPTQRRPTLSRERGAPSSDDTTLRLGASASGRVQDPPTSRPVQAEASVVQPATFGRYKVLHPLGTGGFGTVYLGFDEELKRSVAIKVRRRRIETSYEEPESFLEEARKIARLRHPGVVTVHDVGTSDDGVYIVSDYLEGSDLGRWLRANRASWQEAVRIVAAVADALAHAHARSIIHRDVKPSNIILTNDGAPVLVDFGLALDEVSASREEKGIVSGTPFYMSPEQAAGDNDHLDGRTDIYSLGVVLYELLTDRTPFRAREMRELFRQVLDDAPQPPRQLVAEIPPDLEQVCLKALAKNLSDRYSTARDFADDLRRLLPGDSASSTSSRPLEISGAPPAASTRRGTATHSTRRRAREAEHRQVTVLVCGCDLFESAKYLDLGAEEKSRALDAFKRACEQAVQRFEGTIVQCNEQGLLVCFGYPIAFENGARRAARTGLGVIENLSALGERLHREHKLELQAWVGIHTGSAIVESTETGVSLDGEARDVTRGLKEVAVPGEVIGTETTYRLIQGWFECASLGQQKINGVTQPLEIFRVEGTGLRRSALEMAAPTTLTPLVGRDQELSLLKARWELACDGAGQVVLLIGEPGLGKSRLVYTMKQFVEEQAAEATPQAAVRGPAHNDSSVLFWRCSPHFQHTGLHPAIDFFECFLGFQSGDTQISPGERLERLVRYLSDHNLARPDVVPLFASLLSIPTDERFPAPTLSAAREKEEIFRVLQEWLLAVANRHPVLFVVEDLHWVDASTLDFLGRFLAEGLHDQILTLLTFRPEFQTPWPALAHQTSLALTRLTRRQVGDLISKKTGDALSESVIDQVFARAGGVPLFVEEFTKVVQESKTQPGADGEADTVLSREIPATLQDLVMARLDRMEGDREVAQLAATLGREFGYELLAAAALVDETTLRDELAKLVEAELLFQKGRPPRSTYAFKHALLQDALYNSLIKSERQILHLQVAEALEEHFPDTATTQPELLAYHLTEAGLKSRAISYWLKAGLRARERSAEIDAISHLSKGRALVETQNPSPERDARELEILTPLGTAYISARGYATPEVGPIFLRARELCERFGQPPQLFAIMLGIWEWHTMRGDLRHCENLAREGMEFAKRFNDPGMWMEALFMTGETMIYRGAFAEARGCFVTAIKRFDDRERTKLWAGYTGHNAGITNRSNLAVALWHLGYPDQAIEMSRDSLHLALEVGHPFSLAYALHHAAWLYGYCRLGPQILAAAQEEIAIATAQGFALWHATGTFFKGAGLFLRGDHEQGLNVLTKGLAAFRATGAELMLTCQLAAVGEACTRAGRFREATCALDEAIVLVEKNDERCHEAELQRLQGELLLAQSTEPDPAAEGFFRRAIATARQQKSKAWELRATMSLARLWQRQGREEAAHGMLAALYSAYTEGFSTPDLLDAKTLLQSLSTR